MMILEKKNAQKTKNCHKYNRNLFKNNFFEQIPMRL